MAQVATARRDVAALTDQIRQATSAYPDRVEALLDHVADEALGLEPPRDKTSSPNEEHAWLRTLSESRPAEMARRRGGFALVVAVVAGLAAWSVRSDGPPEAANGAPTQASTDLAPNDPGARRCDSTALEGPATAPAGAVTVTTAQNLADVVNENADGTTYWLEPGTHHLPKGAYSQVIPHDGDTFIGAPGAILDGRHENRYAFGGNAADVTISS